MKRVLVIVLVVVFSNGIIAQNFQGIATYKSQRKVDVKLDSTQVSSEMHQRMMDMLKKQFQQTFTLTFNKEESIYKKEEKLEAPQPQGMVMVMVQTGGSDILYKHLKEKRFTNQNESFSKLFLIKDKLQEHKWELRGETKFIGEYECYKATKKRDVEVIESGVSIDGDKDLSTDANEAPKMKTIEVVAWYTTQLPVNNGPANYHGLPGLILEVNDGLTTIVCSKIVINPDKELSIVEPKKGKEITQEDYDAIMEKKLEEMEKNRADNWNDHGDGENIEIRIGN